MDSLGQMQCDLWRSKHEKNQERSSTTRVWRSGLSGFGGDHSLQPCQMCRYSINVIVFLLCCSIKSIIDDSGLLVPCKFGEWTAWGACNVDCGDGTKTRTRAALQKPKYGGAACPPLEETTACSSVSCGSLYNSYSSLSTTIFVLSGCELASDKCDHP